MTDTFKEWKDRIAWGMLAGCLSLSLMWAAWVTNELFKKASRGELKEAVETAPFPYLEDRALIRESMADSKEASKETRIAIENNTKAIIQLQAFLENRD